MCRLPLGAPTRSLGVQNDCDERVDNHNDNRLRVDPERLHMKDKRGYQTVLERCANSRVGRKCVGAYLSQSKRIWNYIPTRLRPLSDRMYGRHLHAIAHLQADRRQYFATFFLRNLPDLELIRKLAGQRPHSSGLHVAVLAFSKGAERCSIA